MNPKFLLLFAGSVFSSVLLAQPSLLKMKQNLDNKKNLQINRFEVNEKIVTQASLQISDGNPVSKQQVIPWLSAQLQLRAGEDVLQKKGVTTEYVEGLNIERLQQYFKGIKVEHGNIAYTSRGNAVSFLQIEFYPVDENIRTAPVLSEDNALNKAKAFVGATKFAWDGYMGNDPEFQKPTGEVVFVEDFMKHGGLRLAYKFNIAADEPMSRAYIYVDAENGDILLVDNIIKHVNATGTADTRYSGSTKPIVTDNTGTTFQLRQTRNNHSITTLDYARRVQSTTNNGLAIDFTDADNNWTTAEHATNYDDAAHDVQYAMQFISDYWKNIHNRNSWNNANGEMRSYVHVRVSTNAGYDNAFWGGSAMFYGDGTYYSTNGNGTVSNANGFKPLTCLDVSAHELGHAICQSTANLVYARESGGLNEGFSDIWGACVENYSGLPKNVWLLGDELSGNGAALRDMQNPNAGSQPDTYGGVLWQPTTFAACPTPNSTLNDNCGVHYNSGVLNKWFYIITVGEIGVNDLGDAYNVTGIGFAKSQLIAFLAEQNLTPNANYAATRTACINAATTLYGACSNEVKQVTNAWFAVGVGPTSVCSPVIEFVKGANRLQEGTGLLGSCGSKIYTVGVKLNAAATQNTTLTCSLSGSAVNTVDYTLASPTLTFAAGESGTKNLVINVLDDAAVEGNETITISYSVAANGGDAIAGVNNQTFTLTIVDDDFTPNPIAATPVTTVALMNENFETNIGALPTSWTALVYGGVSNTTNSWVVGSNGGEGVSGQAAYISNNTSTKPLAYTLTSSTDRLLRAAPVSTVGYTRLKLKFRYKVEGQYDSGNVTDSALYDFGRLQYSLNTSTYPFINNPTTGLPITLLGKGIAPTDFSIDLPAALENQSSVYICFRWTNDGSGGSNPPLLIDDVLITGEKIGAGVETTASQSGTANLVAGTTSSYIYSAVDSQLIARVSNLSTNVGCINASLSSDGNGRIQLNGLGGKYATTKAIALTPNTPNATATYNASFYFTANELAIWGIDKLNLKILKIKEGTLPTDNLNQSNSQIITPTVTDNSSTTGTIVYTGDFTGFSTFRLVESTTLLPVLLSDLKATLVREDGILTWRTAQEVNNKGFEILKSYDGVHFDKIDFVVGKGTTTNANKYTFADKYIKPNVIIYYRLRQVDFDGKSVESNTVAVKLSKGTSYLSFIRPNPAHDVVNVNFASQVTTGHISLFDAAGQVLIAKKITHASFQVPLEIKQLPAGIYFIEVSDGEKTERHRLVKN